MDYIRKVCPTCGSEFVVLKSREEKAVYCILHCLSKSKGQDIGIASLVIPA